MSRDSKIERVTDPDPFELLSSADADDRAFGAFMLGSAEHTVEIHETLMRCLGDVSSDVVGFAAQSLALHGDVAALDALLPILEAQAGVDVNPIAWAAAVLANRPGTSERERHSVRLALLRLSDRGSAEVRRQVDILLGPN